MTQLSITFNPKTRYSDAELGKFKTIVETKLSSAVEELKLLKDTMTKNDNTDEDTSWSFKGFEDSSVSLTREEVQHLAHKQEVFIQALKYALQRIDNKTYGICVNSGELIPMERLMAVPHTTTKIQFKK